jgi:L-iditol 2-dehydrogenase
MKACVYNPDKEGFLELKDVDQPKISANSALVKIRGVGVCGSDLLKLDRALVKPGTILGHELVGEITEISNELSVNYGFKKGDRIVSSHHVPCGKCKFCLNKQESLCTQFKSTNFNPGAFCEYLELSEDHLKYTVQKVPEKMSDLEASFTEPLACCIKAIERSGIKEYKSDQAKVLVLGLGSIGLLIGQLVKYYRNDLELTGLDLMQERLDLAHRLGFDKLSKKVEGKYDFIFLCAGAGIETAIEHAENGAKIVVFSSLKDNLKGFSNNEIYYKELSVMGSYSPNLDNLKEALNLIKTKSVLVKDLISHKASLENLGSIINQARQEKGIKVFLEN